MASKKKRETDTSYRGPSYYSYGNVAYDVQPEYSPVFTDEKEEALQRKKQADARRKKVIEHRITAMKLVGVVIVLFAGCLLYMGMHVQTASADLKLRQARTELANLKSSNEILAAEISEQMDLDYIREQATTRLGMVEPQAYQIVYINVPKQGYTVQYAVEETVEEKATSLLGSILNLFKKD